MMVPDNHIFGRALYGILFLIILPVLLVVWALAAEQNVSLPAIHLVLPGILVAAGGALLMAWGLASLMMYGKGLPMNPYPPPRYVARGPYALLRHPIYVGFGMLCVGAAIWSGSLAGLWLVCPVVILSSAALVFGYENEDLRQRFGTVLPSTVVSLPSKVDAPPALRHRIAVCLLVLVPWAILYEALAALGLYRNGIVAMLPLESELPVLEWTEVAYLSTYVLVSLTPFTAPTQRILRQFAVQGMIATALMVLFFIAVPLIAPPRPFIPRTPLGELLQLERSLDTSANAFPSYHVTWILLSMGVYAARMPRIKVLWWTVGILVSLSCITTGMHTLVDVIGGVVLFALLRRSDAIWEALRSFAERVANSWTEWRWGPVRLINHGLFAGIGSCIAVGIVGVLAGSRYIPAIVLVAVCSLVTAGLWAQIVEGSPSLLRPYGYYGGVLGVVVGSILAGPVLGADPWVLLAGFSVAGPWVQSLGRLRCLVQGCCHGREAPVGVGIVYRHPRSRVCRLSKLGGVPVHPTPLYSIMWNVVIAVVLTRLWIGSAPLSLISGLYLILTGVGRFVEEAYRGEPQTHVLGGLRLYQWIAILTVVSGAAVTCLPSGMSTTMWDFGWIVGAAALVFGVVTWAALGLDFPGSSRRFARLA